jgi:hypothetical protein
MKRYISGIFSNNSCTKRYRPKEQTSDLLLCSWWGRMDLNHPGTPVHKYGDAPRVPMRHACKARDRGVLCEYVAGSGTQREGMQRRSNASVFVNRGTWAVPTDLQSVKYACSQFFSVALSCSELHISCYLWGIQLFSVSLSFHQLCSAILTIY